MTVSRQLSTDSLDWVPLAMQNQALESRLALQEQAGREHMESARHSAQNFLEQLYRNQHEASTTNLA